MSFPKRLSTLRKERNLTQQVVADRAEIHVAQIRRYESGETQPALDVIRRLALSLNVSADMLVFDVGERGPDDDLLLQFEAVSRFNPEEKKIVKALLEGMILKHETKRIAQISN
jgi:transcriptional regulator with XRE-family HTH domain